MSPETARDIKERMKCSGLKPENFIKKFVASYNLDLVFVDCPIGNKKFSFLTKKENRYDSDCVFLYIKAEYEDYKDDLWQINNRYEGTIFTLLHEIGHFMSKEPAIGVEIKDKWDKLLNEHERKAWLWAFEYRKKHREQYYELVENFRQWYKQVYCEKDINKNQYKKNNDNIREKLGAVYSEFENYINN